MDIIVVGAGPAGLVAGAALARRGNRVTVLDRDGGPAADGTWDRRGVMQFCDAHGFRSQVPELLGAQWPEAHAAWLAAGAEATQFDLPGGGRVPAGVLSRRVTLERVLRASAAGVNGLSVRQGHAERLVGEGGRVRGVVVGGSSQAADLVVDATGRAGRLGRAPASVGGECGIAYVGRTYRLHEGAERGPMSSPISWFGTFDGYLVIVFPHEHGHFSVVVVRPTADAALRDLRHVAAFEAACRAVPAVAEWTDPARSVPTGPVLAGAGLRNTYHPQRRVPGLVAVGDAVTTTAPTAGRGVAMAAMQVGELLRLLDDGVDPVLIAEPLGDWCDQNMRPWVVDHVAVDDAAVLRWQGGDVDLSGPLPSDLLVAAAFQLELDASLVLPYLTMTGLPTTLRPLEPAARALYEDGWRPSYADGPGRDELVEVIGAALASAA